MNIHTEHVFPPIPLRSFDWRAFYDNYDPDAPQQGWGATREEAIEDLKDNFPDETNLP